jgi:hypothetical protein
MVGCLERIFEAQARLDAYVGATGPTREERYRVEIRLNRLARRIERERERLTPDLLRAQTLADMKRDALKEKAHAA